MSGEGAGDEERPGQPRAAPRNSEYPPLFSSLYGVIGSGALGPLCSVRGCQ